MRKYDTILMGLMLEQSKAAVYTVWASFFWGTSFVAIGYGLGNTDVYGFLFLRFFIAALVASVLVIVFAGRFVRHLRERNLWLLGIVNGTAFTLQYIGQTMTGAGKAALLVNLNIVIVAVLSYMIFKERFGKLKIIALPLSIAGVFLLTTGGDFSQISSGQIFGDLLVFLAGAVWAFYIIYTKREIDKLKGDSPTGYLAALLLVTALMTAFPMLLMGKLPAANPTIWALIIYIAIFCTLFAFLFWFRGLRSLSPTTSSIILLLEPVFALVLSVWLLHEPFTKVGIVGAIMILVAMLLVLRD